MRGGPRHDRLLHGSATMNTSATVIDQAPNHPTSEVQTTNPDGQFQAAKVGIADSSPQPGSYWEETFVPEQHAATTPYKQTQTIDALDLSPQSTRDFE